MKKCRLTYDEWKCILSKEQKISFISKTYFEGYVSRLDIEEVSVPQIWKFNGEDTVICQGGYKWIIILPSNEFYCITAMMNEDDDILLWYIDIIADQGIDSDEVPYFMDLFLDLVVYPDGIIIEDDRDELEEALESGEITRRQFELANNTCMKLKKGLLCDIDSLVAFTVKCKKSLN